MFLAPILASPHALTPAHPVQALIFVKPTHCESNRELLGLLEASFSEGNALQQASALSRILQTDEEEVEVSLKGVSHVDQRHLALLVRLYSHLTVRGKRLRLVDVGEAVHALLCDVGLWHLLAKQRSPRQRTAQALSTRPQS